MASRVDVVLRKLPAELKSIRKQYEASLTNGKISDDLLHDIARLIEDCQRVLDWTATDIDRVHGTARDRSPYYPLQAGRTKFDAAMKKDFASVPQAVHDAMEKHQPYQSGKESLGYLHDLARVNKHQDFAPQTRTETTRIRAAGRGGVVEWTPYSPGQGGVQFGAGVEILGVPVDPRTQLPVPSSTQAVTKVIYVGWNFAELDIPVLTTLESLSELIPEAITEVRQAAGL